MNAAAGLTPRAIGDGRQGVDRVAVVAGIAAGRQDEQLLEVDLRAVHVGLADQRLAGRGVAQHLQLASVDGPAQLLPRRRTVERRARLQPEEHADPAGGGLGANHGAGCVLVLREVDDGLEQAGATVRLGQAETDRTTAVPADLAEQRHLGTGVVETLVVAFAEAHRALEDAGPVAAEDFGEGKELVGRGVRARHRPAVGYPMEERTARRQAERTGVHRFVDQTTHRHDVVVGRRRLVEAALAHHVGAQRAVADQAAGVRTLRQAVDRVEVLAVGLPVPGERVEDGVGRDVLDALHHRRERGPIVGAAGRERHAAVPHDHARDAVPAARRADRVPGDLGVEMGVDVDEAGRHEPALGIDLASTGRIDAAVVRVDDRDDHVTADGDVGDTARRAGSVHHGAVSNDDVRSHVPH